MLTKLLKYDLRALLKVLLPIYLISMLLATLNRAFAFLAEQVVIFSIPSGFITSFYVVSFIALPIVTFVFTIIKFYNNLIKDEGYLMHTLPVKKSSLILSKLISAIIMLFLSFTFLFVNFLIGCYGVYFKDELLEILKILFEDFNVLFVLQTIISMIIGIISQQVIFYLSIALGQKHNSKKILYSIIYGVVIYNLVQIISGIVILIPIALTGEFVTYINSNILPMDIMNILMLTMNIMNIIITVISFILTSKTLENKLNLE